MNVVRGHQTSGVCVAYDTLLDFYKILPAHTVVLHVYEEFETFYMKNKTFLSFYRLFQKLLHSFFLKNILLRAGTISLQLFIRIRALVAEVCSDPSILLDFMMFMVLKKHSYSGLKYIYIYIYIHIYL